MKGKKSFFMSLSLKISKMQWIVSHLLFVCSVCLNISDGNIAINMMDPIFNMTTIVDKRSGSVNCSANDFPCLFECPFSNVNWFNGSSECFEASVTPPPPAFNISIGQCKSLKQTANSVHTKHALSVMGSENGCGWFISIPKSHYSKNRVII